MLTWMRTHQKTIMTWTLYLVIPSFVLLYGYGEIQRRAQDKWVAKVNDTEIGYGEMMRMEQNLNTQYQRQYGDQYQEFVEGRDIRQEALDSLIKRQLVLEAAGQFGFGVSNNELAEYIISSGAFQDENGQFNIRRYQSYLYQTRMSQEFFEETVREDVLRSKIGAFISSTMLRSSAETEKEFQRQNEQVMAEMLAFRPEEYTDEVEVDQEGLQAYFDERHEDYRIPEQRRIQYVEYIANDYLDQVVESEGRLNAFFNRNQTKYTIDEARRAEYILYAAANYLDQVSLTEEDVKSFYEGNPNRYQTDRRMQIRFASSPAEEWGKKAEVAPEDLENWYKQHEKQYTHEEAVHARHILLKIPQDATAEIEAQVETKIEEIRQEILDGLDFGEAARKYSEDKNNA
ncbi:MAG: SurA N-terminal domain-containing protein, partial [bacterium]